MLTIGAVALVGIVGATGAGKSTLINLLLRFYDVTRGRILVDGTDIREIPLSRLRSLFSLVLQDVYERVASLLEEHTFMNGDVRTVPRILTYQEIANRVGASREMVGNIMRNLIRGGFIVKDKDRQMTIVRKLPKKW